MTKEDLKILQALPLEVKIRKTKQRIQEWIDTWGVDGAYVSFSGGKDSTVLLHIARQVCPEIAAVFADTGLEYPEIRDFVRNTENVTWIKPKMTFKEVVIKTGYPVISKDVAKVIHYAKRGSKWAIHRLDGLEKDGVTESKFKKRYKKWKFLKNAPFDVGNACCDKLKKEPFHRYEKETGRWPIVGTMAAEGMQRKDAWLKTGCNAFSSKRPMSKPLSFWMEKDIWDYIKLFNVPYSKIYDMGEIRTGCMFCMFGCHLDGEENRFTRMKKTHPKQYEFCMRPLENGGLGIKKVLKYINVPYEKTQIELDFGEPRQMNYIKQDNIIAESVAIDNGAWKSGRMSEEFKKIYE